MTFYPHFRNLSFTYAPYTYFNPIPEINFCLFWGEFFIKLPFLKRGKGNTCEYPKYGAYWHDSALWICRGHKNTVIRAPWSMEFQRCSTLMKCPFGDEERWIHELKGDYYPMIPGWYNFMESSKWTEEHPYTVDGKTVTATISVTEIERRPFWFQWTKLFAKVSKGINVEFSEEVGPGSGSWKGGTTGCGWDMLPGETPKEALQRMEKERTF